MTGRGGRGGRGGGNDTARGCGRSGGGSGQNYNGATAVKKTGLCTKLGANIFDYGQKNSADMMRTTREKLLLHVGSKYGQDISNELRHLVLVVISEPMYSEAIIERNRAREVMLRGGQENLQAARRAQQARLLQLIERADENNENLDAHMRLAQLENEIAQAEFAHTQPIAPELTQEEQAYMKGQWHTYRDRVSKLDLHRGQVFSLIEGQ